jgi:predicted RNA methylase
MRARRELEKAFNWSNADATILGVIYESLIDSVSGDASRKGRRRRSGIFYTPTYITDYLIKAALDSCRSVAPGNIPSVIDPACGCGAFLISAFRELRGRYPTVKAPTIATEYLHGVDSDPDAVSVARLSLAIESGLSNRETRRLEKNIRHGDSLREFPGKKRRYDIVVGNPPYRNVKRGIPDELRDFCKRNYRTAQGQWDLAAPFVELALEHLLVDGGACGLILPNPVLLAENYLPVREIVLEKTLIAFGSTGSPFVEPSVEAGLLVARTGKSRPSNVAVIDGRDGQVKSVRKIPASLILRLPFRIFSHLADPAIIGPVLDKYERGELVPLGDLVTFTRGIETGKKDARVVHSGKNGNLLAGESLDSFRAMARHRLSVTRADEKSGFLKDLSLWTGERQLLLRRIAPHLIAAVVEPPVYFLNTVYRVTGDGLNEHSLCAFLNSGFFREIFRQLFAFDDKIFPYVRVSQISHVPVPPVALNDKKLATLSRELHLSNVRDKAKKIAEIDSLVERMYLSSRGKAP